MFVNTILFSPFDVNIVGSYLMAVNALYMLITAVLYLVALETLMIG